MSEIAVNEAKSVEHIHRNAETTKIKLMKMSKGYQWEISCSGAALADVLIQVRAADTVLKAEWGGAQ